MIRQDKKVFINAEEIHNLFGISERQAYRIILELNEELSSKGYLVVRGRTNRKYLEDKLYAVKLANN